MHHRDTVCGHSEQNWQVSPYDGDVWCFACKPPRNLSEDYRRMMEIAYAAENTQADYGGVEIVTQCSDCEEIERRLDAIEQRFAEDAFSMNNAIASLHQHQVLDARRIDAIEQRLAKIDGSMADLAVGTPTMASFDALVMVVAGIERTVSALRRLAEAQHD